MRKTYCYQPVYRDAEVKKMMDTTNVAIGKIGACIGVLGVCGYFLYKKVNELSKEVKKLKEETGK